MKDKLILFASIIIPFLFATVSLIWLENLIFWYDPARDLLSAWNNLSNPTLIGPTSGIPGIFYGPYWVWLLSFGTLFSKNPLVITFITATLPYFILFPLIWFRFSPFLDRTSLLIGWILFITSSTTGFFYATQLWNPHPAPLLTLAIIYLLVRSQPTSLSWQAVLTKGLLGFLVGMLITFHISFGIALSLGVILFLTGELLLPLLNKKKEIKQFTTRLILLTITGFGALTAFLPTLVFEIRHGFNQIQTLINTFSKYGAVVETKGLGTDLILKEFFNTFATILHLPISVGIIVLVGMMILLIIAIKKQQMKLLAHDKRLLLIIGSILFSVVFIYFSAKNPIWEYHFVGVEIPMLIGICFLIHKIPLLKKAVILLTVVVTVITCISWYMLIVTKGVSVMQKYREVVQTITQDADTADYTVFTYSPSIYSYEYSYLFLWLADKNISYDPGQNVQDAKLIYLIVPHNRDDLVQDFINYRGNAKDYDISKSWIFYNDIEIIKKIRKDNR